MMRKFLMRIFIVCIFCVSSPSVWAQNNSEDVEDVEEEVIPPPVIMGDTSIPSSDNMNQPPVVAQPPELSTSATSQTFLDVLDLKDMDILDVLKLISKRTGLNIVANQDVKGRISIYLKSVEVMDALRIIVGAYDWAYIKDGDIVKVMTAKDFEDKYGFRFGENLETRVKQLVYASSADAQAIVTQIKTAKSFGCCC